MQRVRIGIVGAGAMTEWAILPALSGPDVLSPPDEGAWWNRRPSGSSDVPYQPPARPEVVALADSDGERARRVGRQARVRAVYEDWRLMLREVPLDALLCPFDVTTPTAEELVDAAGARVRWIWLDGAPATSPDGARELQRRSQGHPARLWCARPLRRAAAHRVALRLTRENQLGEIMALALRWGAAFHFAAPPAPLSSLDRTGRETAREAAHRFAATYAALDLLLAVGAAQSPGAATAQPLAVLATAQGGVSGAASLWLRLGNDVAATALFAGADSWNSSLPRLEICGTQGRSIVCEAGRRLWLHQPRAAAHLMEPPGLAPHISAANVLGIAEDLKAFLSACADDHAPRLALDTNIAHAPLWPDAGRVLQLWQAACRSSAENRLIEIPPLKTERSATEYSATAPPPRNETLPLQLLEFPGS